MTADQAELDFDEPRKRIGVIAAQLSSGQERTLAALAQAFPVSFERTDLSGVDGLLILGPASPPLAPADLPQLTLSLDMPAHTPITVALTDVPVLARPLRGRTIPQDTTAGESPPPPAGAMVLATVDGTSVWWETTDETAPLSASAYPLAGLRDGEALREHLRAGRFMGLLPLIHFLTQLLGADGWQLPPPRASFVIDDPNLHWPSYGFIDYRELAAHAARHGYHLGLATVPLDGWLADRRAAALLAHNTSTLSLSIHGNDHIARELEQLNTDARALSAMAQALRRIAALERRAGVSVDRVMIPPHSACSEPALRAMFRLGFDAACSTKPHPWRYDLPAPTPLAGWRPAELVAGGIPVLPRYPFGAPREDLALQALLGHPLILYGHHDDFAQELDFLAQAADDLDTLGDVRWGPLSWIATTNFSTRRLGDTLLVRMHARRIIVDIPAGVRTLRLLLDEPLGGAAGHRLTHRLTHTEAANAGGIRAGTPDAERARTEGAGAVQISYANGLGVSGPLIVHASSVDAPTQIELTLTADRPLRPEEVSSPGVRPWPLLRRALAETRDRTRALRG